MDEISKKVCNAIGEHPELNDIQFDLDTNFRDDLGLDSLVIAELTIELEDVFNIRFPDSAIGSIQTVKDVIEQVKVLLKA